MFFTPLPTIRWDAIVLNLTWLYYNVVTPESRGVSPIHAAGIMAAIMCFISAGWAAGDVSLGAFIQTYIPQLNMHGVDASKALPSVMSFLYVTYIVVYAIMSTMIGYWIDGFSQQSLAYETESKQDGLSDDERQHYIKLAADSDTQKTEQYFYWISGVLFSLVSVVVFANTFTPVGSWKLNPVMKDIRAVILPM
jgi:hypothetical protein